MGLFDGVRKFIKDTQDTSRTENVPERTGKLMGEFLKEEIDLSDCDTWTQLGPYLVNKGYLDNYDNTGILYINKLFADEFSIYLNKKGIDSTVYKIPKLLSFALACIDSRDCNEKFSRSISNGNFSPEFKQEYLLELKRTIIIMDNIWKSIKEES